MLKTVFVILFCALLLRVGFLQLVQGNKYRRQSEENRLRVKEIAPVRGLIFDRKGRIIVDNRPGYTISGAPSALLKNAASLSMLRNILSEPDNNAWESLAKKYLNRRTEIRLKRDIDFERLAAVEANMLFLPGIYISVEPKRFYPYHTATHILGYLGEIDSDELSLYKGFKAADIVGKKGIERSFNELLFGSRGFNVVEVDAAGNMIRNVSGIKDVPAQNGNDLYLTLDLDLQRLAEELLSDNRGAVVAIDPNNGDVLALASSPDYDPEMLSGVVKPEDWNSIVNDPGKPLLNRALQGTYPPGSTIKMVILAAALEEGIVTLEDTWTCTGVMQLGRRPFKCWKENGHGKMNAIQAIEQSCDVYFYNLGLELGIENMAAYFRKFGFGAKTGIDIENEVTGLIPDTKFMDARYGKGQWTRGHLMNISIGQGDVLTTPLQLAVFCSALANGGVIPVPHIFKGTIYRNPDHWEGHKPVMKKIEGISERTFQRLRQGMFKVVQGDKGTAHWLMDPKLEIAGKTGTAQNPHGEDHAWFIGFAPYDSPAIVVCALVEHGEHGTTAAAPIVVKIIKRYLQLEKPVSIPNTLKTVG